MNGWRLTKRGQEILQKALEIFPESKTIFEADNYCMMISRKPKEAKKNG